MTRVLVAMSGGVDSSVAAGLLAEAGHEVVGVTLKLWGGTSDSGCCSVGDAEDARRVAEQLGIVHYVFDLSDDFERDVVGPYAAGHSEGRTPNPCVECNRHIKFDRLLRRARRLGFEKLATGHYARVGLSGDHWRLQRALDASKDQSYVLSMLGQEQLCDLLLPLGGMLKTDVRTFASSLGLRTAAKPESMGTCFISRAEGRHGFLSDRIALRPGRLVNTSGDLVGSVPAVEMVTVGQRRGLGSGSGTQRRFALSVDVANATVVVGSLGELESDKIALERLRWVSDPPEEDEELLVQASAHGSPSAARLDGVTVQLTSPRRRVAPGQTVVLYRGDAVIGSGIAS